MRTTYDYDRWDVLFFLGSVFFAFVLSVIPWTPVWFLWLQPNWVLLVLIFWLFIAPEMMGLGWFFAIGLFHDLVFMAAPLGMCAMSYSLMAFVFVRMAARFEGFPLWQQMLMVAGLTVLQDGWKLYILSLAHQQPQWWPFCTSVLVSCLVWPLVYRGLYSVWRRRLRVY